jgi:cell division initiation protein
MKLSPLEIKQQTFARTFRGYDKSEVQSFLNVMAGEWELLHGQIRELEKQVERLTDQIEPYRQIEQALHETLQTARESSEKRLQNAREEARNRIERAELEAEKIMRDAREVRMELRNSTLRLLERRQEIIKGMKSYLDLAGESLGAFEKDDMHLYELPPGDEFSTAEGKQSGGAASAASSKPEAAPDAAPGEASRSGTPAQNPSTQKNPSTREKSGQSLKSNSDADNLDALIDDL